MIQREEPGVPKGLFEMVVPVRPQRFDAIATFIRCPRVIQHAGADGFVAVICDLTRTGGHYFAATLPRTITVQALIDFLHPLTKEDDRPLQVLIGVDPAPKPLGEQLILCNGDVITAIFDTRASAGSTRHRIPV